MGEGYSGRETRVAYSDKGKRQAGRGKTVARGERGRDCVCRTGEDTPRTAQWTHRGRKEQKPGRSTLPRQGASSRDRKSDFFLLFFSYHESVQQILFFFFAADIRLSEVQQFHYGLNLCNNNNKDPTTYTHAMAHSLRSKSKLKSKKSKTSNPNSDYFKAAQERTERLALKLKENSERQNAVAAAKTQGTEPASAAASDLEKVNTHGWRKSRTANYKKKKASKKNKSLKF